MQYVVVDIIDEAELLEEGHLQLVDKILQFASLKEAVDGGAEVSVSFVNDAEIQVLNQTYRGIDAPTDVLSFSMEELGEDEMEIALEGVPQMLGDIIISVDKVVAQAAEFGHSFERELGFLVLHGFLHLLGYDHMDKADEKVMFGRQDELLAEYGLKR